MGSSRFSAGTYTPDAGGHGAPDRAAMLQFLKSLRVLLPDAPGLILHPNGCSRNDLLGRGRRPRDGLPRGDVLLNRST